MASRRPPRMMRAANAGYNSTISRLPMQHFKIHGIDVHVNSDIRCVTSNDSHASSRQLPVIVCILAVTSWTSPTWSIRSWNEIHV